MYAAAVFLIYIAVCFLAPASAEEIPVPAGDGAICLAAVTIAGGSDALKIEGCALPRAIIGKILEIPGAGPGGGMLDAIVHEWVDARSVRLSVPAATGLSGARVIIAYGTDDTAALQAALD